MAENPTEEIGDIDNRQSAGGRVGKSRFQDVSQLTDIARPVMLAQQIQQFLLKPANMVAKAAIQLVNEVLTQFRYVLFALAQGNEFDAGHVQAEEKVLPEARIGHATLQILIG